MADTRGDNSPLLVDLYELTMSQSYFTYKNSARATFDLFVRSLPRNRSYLVFCGLEDILAYIKNLKFNTEEIGYLKRLGLFSDSFLEYLGRFKFRGDIWAMREGEVFFPNEPVVRVTASIIEAQIIESFLLSTVNLQSTIASKASRVVNAACGKGVYDFSLRRTHGPQAAVKVARSSYLAGCIGTSNVYAAKLYNIPTAGTMAHSLVMSFKNEIDSFLAYASNFPSYTTLLVDTYDNQKGIENAVTVGLYLKAKGYQLQGIRLDSGDRITLAKLARHKLDKAGLRSVKIFLSGNLDEFEIKKILDRNAPVDNFGVGTNMGTSIDAPCLDIIYKISEVTDGEGRFLPTMKLSSGKANYPGRKQVFRISDARGKFLKDILGLEGEKIRKATPLLKKVVEKGRMVHQGPSLNESRFLLKEQLMRFSPKLKTVYSGYRYPVVVSPRLEKLTESLSHWLKTKHQC